MYGSPYLRQQRLGQKDFSGAASSSEKHLAPHLITVWQARCWLNVLEKRTGRKQRRRQNQSRDQLAGS